MFDVIIGSYGTVFQMQIRLLLRCELLFSIFVMILTEESNSVFKGEKLEINKKISEI